MTLKSNKILMRGKKYNMIMIELMQIDIKNDLKKIGPFFHFFLFKKKIVLFHFYTNW
jgi:hypothetical protein